MFKVLKSLLAGLLAGTALGVLFSPDKGDKIRKNIKKEVSGGGTGLAAIWDTFKKMGQEVGESAKGVSQTEGYKKAKRTIKKKLGR